jgi:hypothetical protein
VETKKGDLSSNPGLPGCSLWQSCLMTSPTEPSSLVRELGTSMSQHNLKVALAAETW